LPVTIPLAVALAPSDPGAVPAGAWAGFAYVTVLSQYLGFFAWNAGLALGGIARVSQVQLLQTFVTLGIARASTASASTVRPGPPRSPSWALVLVGRRAAVRRA
jgi:drug/metabolite transporter (DMT)-like permease